MTSLLRVPSNQPTALSPSAADAEPTSLVRASLIYVIAAAVIGRLLSLGFYPLMDTTEARYADIARMMVELNDWITPWFDYGVPFWGKPPLAFWITALSFKVFGINEFAARLPHWLCGVLAGWLVWGLAVRRSYQEAVYAMALLAASALYFVAAGAVMIDMALAVGTTMVMRGFWLGLHGTAEERQREAWMVFAGLSVGLLAKGPIALVLSGLPIALWTLATGNVLNAWRNLPWLRGVLAVAAVTSPWYVVAELRTPGFLHYFLVGEHWQRFVVPGWTGDLYGSAHKFPRGTIWLFLLADLLPWSVLLPLFAWLGRNRSSAKNANENDRNLTLYLLLWALTPAVFFTLAGNILWAYVLPGFPALALLASKWLAQRNEQHAVERLLIRGTVTTLAVALLFLVSLPIRGTSEVKSAKALVADYNARRTPDQHLIVLDQRVFSADFYSRGKAEYATDATSLSKRIEQKSAFVAIKTTDLPELPLSLTQQLKPVSVHGRYSLFIAEQK